MARKILGLNDPGDSSHFGSTDIDKINQLLTGTDQTSTDPVTTNTQWTFTKAIIDSGLNTIKQAMGPDVYMYIDPNDNNKIKARFNKTGSVISDPTSASNVLNSIASTLTSGGTIFTGPGTFVIDSPFAVTSAPISVVGSGREVTIFKRTGTFSLETFRFLQNNCCHQHFTIDANWPTVATSSAQIVLENNSVLRDVSIKGLGNSNGVNCVPSGGNCVIDGCVFIGVGTSTNYFVGVFANTGTTSVSNSYFTGCAGNAISINESAIIDNCYFLKNATTQPGGQLVTTPSAVSIAVRGCYFNTTTSYGVGTSMDSGIELAPQATPTGEWIIVGNRFNHASQYGIVSNAAGNMAKTVQIANNIIKNSQRGYGINLQGTNPSNWLITGNICYDDQGTPTQTVGISIAAAGGGSSSTANNIIVENNICYPGALGASGTGIVINTSGANVIVRRNIGYVSENGGLSTFNGTGSQTAFVIPHGLAAVPTVINVSPSTVDARGNYSLIADATNITVTYPIAPPSGTNNVSLYWDARIGAK